MSALPRRCAVLVVGAGPTGLSLAIRLRQLGVDCLLIDREPAPMPWTRALGLQARTLEILDALGVLDAVRQRSRQLVAMHLHNQNGVLMEMDLTTLAATYPWVLSCPQPEVEQCLEEHYLALGGHLCRNVTLDSFRQQGGEVRAVVTQGGTTHEIAASLLVGCDGAHSRVREQLGISFDGVEHPDRFLLADVDIDWDYADNAAHVFMLPDGALYALPLPHGWRLVLNLGAQQGNGSEQEAPVSLAPFEERLASIFEQPPTLSSAYWLNRFSIHRRLAGRYRVNRVLLAGDACHVQSPVGAQGMNTGIADAFNLAWKIGLFLDGVGGGRLLDSYETERRPVARTMLTSMDLVSRASFTRNTLLRGARDSILKLAGRQPRFAARFLRRLSQLDVSYTHSSIVGAGSGLFAALTDAGPEPGERMPDAALETATDAQPLRVHTFLQEPSHRLFIQLSSTLGHQEIVAAFALADRVPGAFSAWVKTAVVLPGDVPETLRDLEEFDVNLLVDRDGEFARCYGDQAALWLMRPDGHLGYRAHLSDGDQLLLYLRNLFARRD